MPNFLAYAMMAMWPLFALIIYKKFGAERAAILVFLVPYLLLPEKTEIDLPLLPSIDKTAIIGLAAYFILKKHINKSLFFTNSSPIKFLLILGFLTPAITVMNNTESLSFIEVEKPGLTWWDGVTYFIQYFSLIYAPFIVGYYLLSTPANQRNILIFISTAGLIYLIPIAWEVRMSPQLHSNIYGFFPHDFRQQIRNGGFRPVVFLGHGLTVSAFMVSAFIAACVLMRQTPNFKYKFIPAKFAFIALLIGVILCKSLGGLFIATFILVTLFFTSKNRQTSIALFIGLILFSYPLIRDSATPALDKISALIEAKNPDRAQSFSYRLNMETMILDHANSKALTGWGSFGRNFVRDMNGNPISVPDGHWVLLLSTFGWLGYISIYGLLTFTVLKLRQHVKKQKDNSEHTYAIGLAMVLTATMIDVIPNSSFSNMTMLLAGSLAGSILQGSGKSGRNLTPQNQNVS
ncbi:hypothetical protein [Marinagarivorans cellulosilyticus]|uniref:Uncharacterized protein n=1 Tax=Marinagarivorans cellulosilyticus TaxID=2721545 RepID=A0AAN1WH14_9GAMM|nr:hypothetical protein [Marinagarivorans cellulosilyticus]BCD97452.1 hypothetical protein MARGE09_P1653 [Marinagarivorans cellulosilyticus]